MIPQKEGIPYQLKTAREASGLSQRALTTMTGLQQAQISKIENGSVDPRLNSLIAMARALELELILVPRRSLPALNSVLNEKESISSRPAYSLEGEEDV